jgi:hypothetical protein
VINRFHNRIVQLERLAPPPPKRGDWLRFVTDEELDRIEELAYSEDPPPGWDEGYSPEELARIKDRCARAARARCKRVPYPVTDEFLGEKPRYPVGWHNLSEEAQAEIAAIHNRAEERRARGEAPFS